jgi:hypothetical protein
MDLLQELLNLHDTEQDLLEESYQSLFEDLGNLNKIDKKLFKIFLKPKSTWGEEAKKAAKVRGGLGQNSSIEESKDANQNAAWAHLDTAKNKAIVLEYDGEQIFAVIKATGATTSFRSSTKATYSFILNPSYFEKIMGKDEFNKAAGGVIEKSSRNRNGTMYTHTKTTGFEAGRTTMGGTTDVIGKLKTIMKFVFEAAKKNKKELKTLIVTIDEKRLATSGERAKSRKGMQPWPTGNRVAIAPGKYDTYENLAERYFKDLKSDLKGKLESLKASKAKTFDTPSELLAGLIKEGYFEKLKFMGFTYQFYTDRINFKGMQGDKFYGESYIEYKLQTGTPEYKKIEDELNKLRTENADVWSKEKSAEEKELLQAAYYEKRKKLVPPGELKIVLGLEGGVITPKKVQVGREDAYIW